MSYLSLLTSAIKTEEQAKAIFYAINQLHDSVCLKDILNSKEEFLEEQLMEVLENARLRHWTNTDFELLIQNHIS